MDHDLGDGILGDLEHLYVEVLVVYDRMLALFRNAVEQRQYKACDRIILIVRELDFHRIFQIAQRHVACDDVIAVGQSYELVIVLVELVAYVAHELFQDILDRADAHRSAVLIDDNGHLHAGILHLTEQ